MAGVARRRVPGPSTGTSDTAGTVDRATLVDRYWALRPDVERRLAIRLPEDLRCDLASVTVHQLEVLSRLKAGGRTMGELARDLGVSESAATALADRLVRQGLTVRQADPSDRRIVRLVASDHARSLLDRFQTVRCSLVEEAFLALSDRQLVALVDIFETLARSAGAPEAPAAGGNGGPPSTAERPARRRR